LEYTNSVLEEIINYFKNNQYATRLTLSGGDPMFSPEIVLPICQAVKEVRPDIII